MGYSMNKPSTQAETVRNACIAAAVSAYEEGGVLGLCAEGRWEYAVSAMRQLDVAALVQSDFTSGGDERLPKLKV